MAVLENIRPKDVFKFFEEICGIPHASYHEKEISDYLVDFAKKRNLEYYQDSLYNVIIIKEATKGFENKEPIIIQGHMDMVAEKESDCEKDMLLEGLDLYVDGDFVKAKKTTLGADDGVAVAMALAILDDEELKHPRIEFICTVSEEIGMEGAAGIDVSMIKGRKLLNLDSEEEGVFIVGCAGGATLNLTLEANRKISEGEILRIEVNECTGGHSGEEIDKGRANASHLVNRLLASIISDYKIGLVTYAGGAKDNAIPRSCEAEIRVFDNQLESIRKALLKEAEAIKKEYAISDAQMQINVFEASGKGEQAFSYEDTLRMVQMINALPNGVQTMSLDIDGLVETSLNLGILKLEGNCLKLCLLLRSSVDSAKAALKNKIRLIAESFGARYEIQGEYPAWEFARNSEFRDSLVDLYEQDFQTKPVVKTMHAGVECGLLVAKLPGLEVVSLAPDIFDIHTPRERLSISSTERVYGYVKHIIENM